MDAWKIIAERRIEEAIKCGDFDDLPLKGRLLPEEGLDAVPAELRVGYRVLKNAGVLPPEMELKKEIVTLRQLLSCCLDGPEKKRLAGRLNDRLLRLQILMGK